MWAEPSLLFVLWFLGWREFTAKRTSEHQSSPVRLLFYLTCFLFIVITLFFSHLKHGIQYKSPVKNFIWNARLIKYRKINRNHEGKMKGYNIDSVELFSIVFKGITIQFHDACKCFCTLILNKSMWSAFTQCWRRRGILSENDLA